MPLPPAQLQFAFTADGPPGYTRVAPNAVYSDAAGFGYDLGTSPGGKAYYFSAKSAEGNFRLRLEFGDKTSACVTTVKAESRRLMVEQLATAAGATASRDIIVNVRNSSLPAPPANAPGGDRVRLNEREQGSLTWDGKLTLEVSGDHSCLRTVTIEPANVPTIYIAGDSTVTDQPAEPYGSWGQMLPRFFRPEIAVANHAESGETLKSFLTGLRLDKILSRIQPGDYLLIQFGHNDMKQNWPQTFAEASTTYKAYVRAYVAEARRRGGKAALVTSLERRQFDAAGRIRPSLEGYPEAMRELARELNTPLIDLNALSVEFYEALGPARAPKAFANDGKDATHQSPYGAYELARCVVEGIRANVPELARYLSDDAGRFDPRHPDPPEAWSLPLSPKFNAAAPRGN
jgi:lysophospholipase L1-like esterase